ncbi:hypothetical protein ACSBR2_026543 [Camellia fascicularis]
MSNSIKGVHILIFPYPAQGHMLPMLDLAHQLALRGITITILVTPKNLPILNPLLSTHHPSSIQTLVLPFPPHPSLPSGVENIKDIGNAGNLPMINALGKLHDPIIHWFKSHPSPPVAILSDFFLGWTLHLAHQLGEYLDHLKNKMGHQRVWVVGPLSLFAGAETMGRINPDKDSGDRVLAWLDGCPDGSVLYVCFGSQKLLKRDQMEALAAGLEHSKIRFVWVVKSVTAQQVEDGYGFVPDGFEDRVLGRGMVLKGWAPQTSILSHRAVSGFLSHCGWNSVLEGIMAGVMILASPMEADQFVNARLLVEDVGAGVRVCEGADAVPDSTELAQTIANSMSGDTSVQKVRAKELKDKAVEAVKESGSSWRDLEGLVNELVQL